MYNLGDEMRVHTSDLRTGLTGPDQEPRLDGPHREPGPVHTSNRESREFSILLLRLSNVRAHRLLKNKCQIVVVVSETNSKPQHGARPAPGSACQIRTEI